MVPQLHYTIYGSPNTSSSSSPSQQPVGNAKAKRLIFDAMNFDGCENSKRILSQIIMHTRKVLANSLAANISSHIITHTNKQVADGRITHIWRWWLIKCKWIAVAGAEGLRPRTRTIRRFGFAAPTATLGLLDRRREPGNWCNFARYKWTSDLYIDDLCK